MPIIAAKHELEFLKKVQLTEDAYSFYFKRSEDIDFLPGQFLRLTLNLPEPSERGSGRFFSIASSPTEKEYLMITVRTSPKIYKKTLLDLKAGEKVQISLPYGLFILKPEETFPRILLAGGIGITPFRSMIKYVFDSNLKIPVTLFTSFRKVEDRVFQNELKNIANTCNWLKLVETITQPEESKFDWTGITGRIDENLIKRNVTNLSEAIYYIAGPPAMVDAMSNLIKSLGVEMNRIRIEKFTGY